jgi:hypothetical protein
LVFLTPKSWLLKFLRGLRDLRGEKPALPGLQNTEKTGSVFHMVFRTSRPDEKKAGHKARPNLTQSPVSGNLRT